MNENDYVNKAEEEEDGHHRYDSAHYDDNLADNTGTESRFKSIEKTIQTILAEDDKKRQVLNSKSYSKKRRLIYDLNQIVAFSHNANDEQNDRGGSGGEEDKDGQEIKMQWMRPNPSLFFQLASEYAVDHQCVNTIGKDYPHP